MNEMNLSRRDFCRHAVGITLAASAAPIPTGVARAAGSAEAASRLELDLSDPANTALNSVGGAVKVSTSSVAAPVIVVRNSETEVSAFLSRCTHQGCEVNLPVGGVVSCPCHGSTYDDHGRVTAGPAMDDLQGYDAQLAAGKVIITIDGLPVDEALPDFRAPRLRVRTDARSSAVEVTLTEGDQPVAVDLRDALGRTVRGIVVAPGVGVVIDTRSLAPGQYSLAGTHQRTGFIYRLVVAR